MLRPATRPAQAVDPHPTTMLLRTARYNVARPVPRLRAAADGATTTAPLARSRGSMSSSACLKGHRRLPARRGRRRRCARSNRGNVLKGRDRERHRTAENDFRRPRRGYVVRSATASSKRPPPSCVRKHRHLPKEWCGKPFDQRRCSQSWPAHARNTVEPARSHRRSHSPTARSIPHSQVLSRTWSVGRSDFAIRSPAMAFLLNRYLANYPTCWPTCFVAHRALPIAPLRSLRQPSQSSAYDFSRPMIFSTY